MYGQQSQSGRAVRAAPEEIKGIFLDFARLPFQPWLKKIRVWLKSKSGSTVRLTLSPFPFPTPFLQHLQSLVPFRQLLTKDGGSRGWFDDWVRTARMRRSSPSPSSRLPPRQQIPGGPAGLQAAVTAALASIPPLPEASIFDGHTPWTAPKFTVSSCSGPGPRLGPPVHP